jgi:hypothetical protein
MRVFKLIILLSLIFTFSCDKNTLQDDPGYSGDISQLISSNLEKVTIKTGIAGTLLKTEGNCMPSWGVPTNCHSYPVSRTINIYEYTKMNDAVRGLDGLFSSVKTKLISRCDADKLGFFQVTLLPGKYSVFVSEKGSLYATRFDGSGGINPYTVVADSISRIVQVLDYAVY